MIEIRNKKEVMILLMIIVLAFVLRTFPYLNGYSYPITDDGTRDYKFIEYIQQTGEINLQAYGIAPFLHLIVSTTSILSDSNTLKIDLFLPPLISSLGLIFFYFFIKKYSKNISISLISTLIVATFGPNIWWGAQAVRETIGLFFFPLSIYLLDKFREKNSIKWFIIYFISLFGMTLAHYWASFMLIIMIFLMNVFFYKNKGYGLLISFVSLLPTFIYWAIAAPFFFFLINKGITIFLSRVSLFKILVISLIMFFVMSYLKKYVPKIINNDLLLTKKVKITVFTLTIASIIFLYIVLNKLLVFAYPPQQFLSVIIAAALVPLGFLYAIKNNTQLSILYITYIITLSAMTIFGVVIGGSDVAFDPVRVLEFIIYPMSFFAATIVSKLNKTIISVTLIICILVGLFFYPPIFVLTDPLEKTPFFDIRSYIRYTPIEGGAILKWSQENNVFLTMNGPTINGIRDTFFLPVDKTKKCKLVSEYDYKVSQYIDKVNYRSLGAKKPDITIQTYADLRYANGWGNVYCG
ncbi:glycosyltransferase family 39 protein [archaeon]|nr:glycosyltransferase family 39 protein [Nanoarchaeota archaeon]MCG2723878.1 glycosyltransferase family 39 protein [archaeon]